MTNPMLPHPFTVERVRRETHDTFTLELKGTNGIGGFSFAPGQFNMLYRFGTGEVPISISGDPERSDTLVHTIRAVGTVTESMERLKKGDIIGVRGPFGRGWPVLEARGCDVLIVAGGIGLAPLRPVMYRLLSRREQYGKIAILYGTRTPSDILYSKELEQWRSRFDLQVRVTVDRGEKDWKGHIGVVTTLIPRASFDPHEAVAMICGPEVMMRFTIRELEKRGVRRSNIHVSMERNMKCGIGFCGHCQYGPTFVCKDGPVFPYEKIEHIFRIREI
ncbi:MAG: FAD/NAD(P)-binding protein [Armatimonadetes bacterium]|nr:FAD/NAD(P)-binding protein [Armatimonadota bacterium]